MNSEGSKTEVPKKLSRELKALLSTDRGKEMKQWTDVILDERRRKTEDTRSKIDDTAALGKVAVQKNSFQEKEKVKLTETEREKEKKNRTS